MNGLGKAIPGLWLLLAATALQAAFAPIRLTGGAELVFEEFDRHSQLTEEQVRQFDRLLNSCFRPGNRPGRISCRVVVDRERGGALPEVRRVGDGIELRWDDRERSFPEQLLAVRRLGGALLACRLGRDPGERPERLFPAWMARALQQELAAVLTETRISRSNQYYPLLRRLKLPAGLPDFRELVGLNPELLPPEPLRWYGEFARLLFNAAVAESSSARNLPSDYLLLLVEHPDRTPAEAYDAVLRPAFAAAARRRGLAGPGDDAAAAAAFLADCARRCAFNARHPRTAADGLAQLRRVVTLADGMPLSTLPDQLARSPARESERIRKRQELQQLAEEAPDELRLPLLALREMLQQIDLEHPELARRAISQQCDRIEELWRRRGELEAALDQAQAEFTPVPAPELAPAADFLPAESAQVLDEAQRKFGL